MPLIREKQEVFLFLALLFPFFPDDMLCILAGLTSIPTRRFAVLVLLTRPWGLVFAALLGSGAFSLPLWGWALMLAALVALVLLPGAKSVPGPAPLLGGIAVMELLYLAALKRGQGKPACSWIVIIVWAFMLLWELFTTQLNLLHPVLMPAPEAVFNVFATLYPELLANVWSSLTLLLMGAATAIAAGVLLGALVGWLPELRDVFAPIARVLAPIPSVVFAPYLVALMPTFRLASAMVIFLGLFWPTFLNTILRVVSMDRRIVDSARMLGLSSFEMVRQVVLPYLVPGIVGGLNGQLTSAIMMLTFAEMLGAKSGMGYFIINYTYFANYVNVVAGIIVVGIVVTLLNALINLAKRKLVKWC